MKRARCDEPMENYNINLQLYNDYCVFSCLDCIIAVLIHSHCSLSVVVSQIKEALFSKITLKPKCKLPAQQHNSRWTQLETSCSAYLVTWSSPFKS